MESNRAVLGDRCNGQSGMSICIVVHVMKADCKCVEVLFDFYVTSSTLSGTTVVVHRQECIQTDVDY